MAASRTAVFSAPDDKVRAAILASLKEMKANIKSNSPTLIEGKTPGNWRHFGTKFAINIFAEATGTKVEIIHEDISDYFVKPFMESLEKSLPHENDRLDQSICSLCKMDKPAVFFSKEVLCNDCFSIKYGKAILVAPVAEYHGGHKAYLAGGLISKYETGQMALTKSHLIFVKKESNPEKRWEIVIPLKSVILDRWTIEEETRRKTLAGGGSAIGDTGVAIGGGAVHDSGKAHHIIVPYIDENGIRQDPRFGVSSFRGKAIREWAATLYQQIVEVRKSMEQVQEQTAREAPRHSSQSSTTSSATEEDPLKILKRRLAKGEISKEEYEELRKMLES